MTDQEMIGLLGGFLKSRGLGYSFIECDHIEKYLPEEVIRVGVEIKVSKSGV